MLIDNGRGEMFSTERMTYRLFFRRRLTIRLLGSAKGEEVRDFEAEVHLAAGLLVITHVAG